MWPNKTVNTKYLFVIFNIKYTYKRVWFLRTLYMNTHTHIYIYIYINVCVSVCLYVCLCVCAYVFAYMDRWVSVCEYTSTVPCNLRTVSNVQLWQVKNNLIQKYKKDSPYFFNNLEISFKRIRCCFFYIQDKTFYLKILLKFGISTTDLSWKFCEKPYLTFM